MMDYVLARLSEPSTYAGIGALVSGLGLHVPNATVQAVSQVIMAVAGLAAGGPASEPATHIVRSVIPCAARVPRIRIQAPPPRRPAPSMSPGMPP